MHGSWVGDCEFRVVHNRINKYYFSFFEAPLKRAIFYSTYRYGNTHTLTHTRTHTCTHTHTHTQTHTQTQTFSRKRIFQLRELRNIENHRNLGVKKFYRYQAFSLRKQKANFILVLKKLFSRMNS